MEGLKMEKKYTIQDREAGNIIEECITFEEAKKIVKEFEEFDKKTNTVTYIY